VSSTLTNQVGVRSSRRPSPTCRTSSPNTSSTKMLRKPFLLVCLSPSDSHLHSVEEDGEYEEELPVEEEQ
jgi:hypothetical protein